MEKELICISCPVGCHLTAVYDSKGGISISGNQCKRGELYAREELSEPKRVVTAVVKTGSPQTPYIPVKTDRPVLKKQIPGLLNLIYMSRAGLPVTVGDILISDFAGSGVNVVFTRSVER